VPPLVARRTPLLTNLLSGSDGQPHRPYLGFPLSLQPSSSELDST
jgi:hypothetical protein